MRMQGASLLVVAVMLAAPPAASAQQQSLREKATDAIKRIGVHVNLGIREPLDDGVTAGTTVGLSVGLSPGRTGGWSVPFSLNWTSSHLEINDERFATVRSYFILSGVSYSIRRERWSVGAALEGGFAVNRSKLEGTAPASFDVGNTVVRISSNNSAVIRPQVKAEYFLTRKISVRTSLKYLYTQPDVEIYTVRGRVPGRWNTHYLNMNMGVGIYPFRKAPASEAPPQAPPT